jgi:3-deoxy-D-manno-octulosonic-acid transferase
MWWLYQILSAALLVLVGPFALAARGRHYLPTLRGRLGSRLPAGPRGALWLHAVSVGEAMVAETLVRALPADLPILVTTITPTGQERACRALGARAGVAYAPFELGFAVRRFFDRYEPCALVLVEGDYWPLLLREARRRGLPVAVINGRLSDRSFPRLRLVRGLVRRLLLDRVDRFGVQTALDRERLVALGVPAERVTVTGNLKFEAAEPARQAELESWITAHAAGRRILVAGSTMAGEERLLLDAFAAAGGPADAVLVLAPRHPERFAAVGDEIERRFPGAVRRSGHGRPAGGATPVALLDTLGELAAAYAVADIAFVGGTLVARGGHNPLEPARFAVPVSVGPSMANFREIAAAFDRERAWARVADAAELAAVWKRWLLDPGEAAEIGRRGRDLIDAHRGALGRTLAIVEPLAGGRP